MLMRQQKEFLTQRTVRQIQNAHVIKAQQLPSCNKSSASLLHTPHLYRSLRHLSFPASQAATGSFPSSPFTSFLKPCMCGNLRRGFRIPDSYKMPFTQF